MDNAGVEKERLGKKKDKGVLACKVQKRHARPRLPGKGPSSYTTSPRGGAGQGEAR